MVGPRWSWGMYFGHRLAGLPSPATVKVPVRTFDASRGVLCGCCPPTDSVTVRCFITQAGGTQLPLGSAGLGGPTGCVCVPRMHRTVNPAKDEQQHWDTGTTAHAPGRTQPSAPDRTNPFAEHIVNGRLGGGGKACHGIVD